MKIMLAFKKTPEDWVDKLVMWYTKSDYCHVELLLPDENGDLQKGYWFSANPRKGIRLKPIEYPLDHQNWDYKEIVVNKKYLKDVYQKIDKIKDYKYAAWDIILVQVFKLDKMESRKKMFCSEAVCEILKIFRERKIKKFMDVPCVNFSPEDLHRIYT